MTERIAQEGRDQERDFHNMPHEEFLAWVRSPLYNPHIETFPIHQMGPDGKRRARYVKQEERKCSKQPLVA